MTTTTLEAAALAFEHWRDTRTSIREAVPPALREQVFELLKQHRTSKVISALKINHSMIKRWREKSVDNPHFVELPIDTVHDGNAAQVAIHHPQGRQMSLTGLNLGQIKELMSHFCSIQGGRS